MGSFFLVLFLCILLSLGLSLVLNRGGATIGSATTGSTSERFSPNGAIVLYKGLGGFVEVVGESKFQLALKMARSNAFNDDGWLMFWAILEPENDNPHDENAIVIKYRGEKLGYLSRGDAKTFRASHAEAIAQNLPIAVRGYLTGGVKGKPTLGLMLSFYLDTEKTYKNTPVVL